MQWKMKGAKTTLSYSIGPSFICFKYKPDKGGSKFVQTKSEQKV